jgi:hypothetical protein
MSTRVALPAIESKAAAVEFLLLNLLTRGKILNSWFCGAHWQA